MLINSACRVKRIEEKVYSSIILQYCYFCNTKIRSIKHLGLKLPIHPPFITSNLEAIFP